MKRTLKYIVVALFGVALWSCNEKLDSNSKLYLPQERNSDFDKYLEREFLVPFNLELKYWLDDSEIDQTYQLEPAKIESAKIMAVLLKHLWLDVYSEASPEGIAFDKKYVVRIIQLVGSGAWNPNNTVMLGYAQGGKKIVLNQVNLLDPERPEFLAPDHLLSVNAGDFHTIHHEFAHILNQTKKFSTDYKQISEGDYISDGWSDTRLDDALDLGFITTYSRKSEDEDFVEIYSTYITHTQKQWEDRVKGDVVDPNNGIKEGFVTSEEGQKKIAEKLELVRSYIADSWGMNLDEIRAIILRRANEIDQLDFVNLK